MLCLQIDSVLRDKWCIIIILQKRRKTRKRSFQGPVKSELTEQEARDLLKTQFSDSCDSQEEVDLNHSQSEGLAGKESEKSSHNELDRTVANVQSDTEYDKYEKLNKSQPEETETDITAESFDDDKEISFKIDTHNKMKSNKRTPPTKHRKGVNSSKEKAMSSTPDESTSEKGKGNTHCLIC